MSINTIIELLRAHEDPCTVLERLAPRFAPFELEVALKYAADQYGPLSPVLLSVLVANLRAHHSALWWARMPYRAQRRWTDKIEHTQSWGVDRPQDIAATPLRIDNNPYYLCCVPWIEQGRINLHFTAESAMHEYDDIYTNAFALGLEEQGATLVWKFGPGSEVEELYIPLQDWERLVKTIEHVLSGDQLISYDKVEQRWVSGALLTRAAQQMGLPDDLLTGWIDHNLDGDIPF